MELYAAIRQRRSVRAYLPQPVSKETLLKVMEAARLAPSASNRQPWKFVLVTDPELRRALCEVAIGQPFVEKAPVIIAGVALRPDHIMRCEVPAYPVDLGIAMEHIALAAVAEGLGTCWLGSFSQGAVKGLLNIPEAYKVVELMALGYPQEPGNAPKQRKPLEEIVCFDQFC